MQNAFGLQARTTTAIHVNDRYQATPDGPPLSTKRSPEKRQQLQPQQVKRNLARAKGNRLTRKSPPLANHLALGEKKCISNLCWVFREWDLFKYF